MKLQSLPLLLPCVASIFWLLTYLLFTQKGGVYKRTTRLFIVFSFFFLFAFLSFDQDSRLLLHFTLFEQVSALFLVPVFMSYVREIQGGKPSWFVLKIIGILPYIHMVVGIETVFAAGFENCLGIYVDSYSFHGPMFPYLADKSQIVFYACYTYMFKTFLLVDFFIFSINLMSCAINGGCSIKDVMGFFFKKQKSKLLPVRYFLTMLIFLIVVSALVLGKASYMDNLILVILGCVLLAFLLSMLAFVCTVGDVERHSIPGILRLVRFGNIQSEAYISEPEPSQDNVDGKQSVGGQGFVIPEQAGGITSNESDEMSQTVKAMLESKFENHVKEGNLFLKRELSVQAVADDLKVSRAELIHYLDMVYGMSFQSYINMLRVEYAEQYLISHDDVTQKEIARVCGFSSASAFNTAFSRLTGVTPKIWKDRYLEMNRKENAASDI